MNKLLAAMQNQPTARTWNGDAAHATTWDPHVDLFGAVGSLRKDQGRVLQLFRNALAKDEDLAVRIALWARDVRGGAGERQSFRTILKWLASNRVDIANQVVFKISEVGRWDDLLELIGTSAQEAAVREIGAALHAGNQLCAKWMPRKGPVANTLRKEFMLTPKQYRKLLVSLTNVVESKMCAKQWSEIDFGKLPALASARYQKAFERNAPGQYKKYEKALEAGTAKINAGAIFPHDVVKAAVRGNDVVSSAQWAALPNYMEGADERVLAMSDVSGSMGCGLGGEWGATTTCMDVSIALGMYCAERAPGPFKDHFITFDSRPVLHQIRGKSLREKYEDVRRHGGLSTNVDAAFDLVLKSAVANKVPESDMPTVILILSDMQFNQGAGSWNKTANTRQTEKFRKAGYKVPKLIYWNLNAAAGNHPITIHDSGAAIVSGFSPAILKAVMTADKCDPVSVMLNAVTGDRYNWQHVGQ